MRQPCPHALALVRSDDGRMLALARALRDCEGIALRFALKDVDAAPFHRAGFACELVSTPADLAFLARALRPRLLILDRESGLSRTEVEGLRRDCLLIAALEEKSESRLACDFAYYPPLSGTMALDWTGARTVPRIGWEWTLLRLNPHVTPIRGFSPRPSLLVAMGAHGELAERAARALAPLDSSFRIRFVIGEEMKDAEKLAAGIVAIRNTYETVEGASDFSTEYASADLALCAFGASSYELAAFGVPAISLSLNREDARAADAFAAAGMGLSLGAVEHLSDGDILEAVKSLIADSGRRREMRETCLATMDGLGAARIAGDLAGALREENAPLRAAR